jgi:hypothetical protein
MKNHADSATHIFKSGNKLWTNANDVAVFKPGFIPLRGPNGGIMMIRDLTVHAVLNMTIATAVGLGQDSYRFCRTVDLKTTGGVKRFDNITGDSLRKICYTMLGAERTYEHADLAVAATTDRKFTATLPLSKPWAYDADDTALPADFFEELRIGMASAAEFSLGACVATIHSGYYYVVAECFEQMAIVLPSLDVWRQIDAATTASTDIEIDTGGRLQDAFLFCPGANGGLTLANLTSLAIVGSMPEQMLKDPDLKHAYARARHQATNLFSTVGNPLRSDPFTAADAGTLRALAAKLTTGSKVTDGPYRSKETIKLVLAGALPAAARLVVRYTTPKSEAQRAAIQRVHRVNTSYVKTRDKSRRDLQAWPDDMKAYLPEKFKNF